MCPALVPQKWRHEHKKPSQPRRAHNGRAREARDNFRFPISGFRFFRVSLVTSAATGWMRFSPGEKKRRQAACHQTEEATTHRADGEIQHRVRADRTCRNFGIVNNCRPWLSAIDSGYGIGDIGGFARRFAVETDFNEPGISDRAKLHFIPQPDGYLFHLFRFIAGKRTFPARLQICRRCDLLEKFRRFHPRELVLEEIGILGWRVRPAQWRRKFWAIDWLLPPPTQIPKALRRKQQRRSAGESETR